MKDIEETATINIEHEYHQNRLVRHRHRARIQRNKDLLDLKDQYERHSIDLDEYCDHLRVYSYIYLNSVENQNDS